MGVTHYRLDSFLDLDCRERADRLSLSACDDSHAVEQMRLAVWRHESSGESRALVLSRPGCSGWVKIARIGTRRYADNV